MRTKGLGLPGRRTSLNSAVIAQLEEHLFCNQNVRGSIPRGGTIHSIGVYAMSSAREWASDREDEVTICKHGGKSLYFDDCRCEGCKQDKVLRAKINLKGNKLKDMFLTLSAGKQAEVFAFVVNLTKA
jgi:hypothetical protein